MHPYQRISPALKAAKVGEVIGGYNVQVYVATARYLQLKQLAVTVFSIKNYVYYLADCS
jgi:hypothetical protein